MNTTYKITGTEAIMNKEIKDKFSSREHLMKEGFALAGNTTDETILVEIIRDYSRARLQVLFSMSKNGSISYWTRPQ